ncbi:hypothetical protein PoB_007091100 [Plakobranchus ocellatus]|uniref:Uncharacterized protein n=1 Tax=Plakobranchus ocellatus TaxID=259542 RepID=A0AAV4DJP7_9GAST|nr:hypothetical protein PoB_007091100 [Plakobranchus ocellatus]
MEPGEEAEEVHDLEERGEEAEDAQDLEERGEARRLYRNIRELAGTKEVTRIKEGVLLTKQGQGKLDVTVRQQPWSFLTRVLPGLLAYCTRCLLLDVDLTINWAADDSSRRTHYTRSRILVRITQARSDRWLSGWFRLPRSGMRGIFSGLDGMIIPTVALYTPSPPFDPEKKSAYRHPLHIPDFDFELNAGLGKQGNASEVDYRSRTSGISAFI